ncbi:MAG: nucleotidyl transferase AbiEii/AbiGii toxin family protein [Candidatus Gracilibacteria bacterium]|nr:nucleotidyl transferase AbiEii/AbiGii toxin family protein [Candidatus Gracilibacteria bacterium]
MLNKDKHRQVMYNILKEIFELPFSNKLAFKGGTACYFLYGLDRFSTDLDFDIISDLKSGENYDDEINNILKKYGNIKKGQNILLSYGNDDMNIKIDFSRNIWKNNKYEIVNFYGTDINIQSKDTIFANKLVALTDRKRLANRDIYDVYFFFKNSFPINESIILERTGKTLKQYLSEVLIFIKKLPKNYKILEGLGEVLDEKQKSFVKNKLLNELIGILEMRVNFND